MTTRKGHHERLISAETYERIQERLKEREKLPQRKDLHDDFPLRGFVACADCRKPYTAAWSSGKTKTFAYYRCTTLGCPFRHKSVRADTMHGAFEELLKGLKPRPAILEGVRSELLTLWQTRMLDVETIRKQRQKRLDTIEKEMAGYLDALDKCSSPVVIKKIEERVEELAAKRVRLGGRVEKPKRGEYDFELALNRVLEFLRNPLEMWQTGDLRQRLLVLRLVFTEPLVYDRETGFGTPSFSLPINVACVLELDEMEVVDLVRKSWNSLEVLVREWAEAIQRLWEAKNAA